MSFSRRTLFCLIFSLTVIYTTSAAAGEVKVFRLDYAEPFDVIDQVRELLSPVGKATIDPRSRSIIVVDDYKVHSKVAALLKKLDRVSSAMELIISAYAGCGQVAAELKWEQIGGGWEVGRPGDDRSKSAPNPTTTKLSQSEQIISEGTTSQIEIYQTPELSMFDGLTTLSGVDASPTGPGSSHVSIRVDSLRGGLLVKIGLQLQMKGGRDFYLSPKSAAEFFVNPKQQLLFRAAPTEADSAIKRATAIGGTIGDLCFAFYTDFR